MDPMEYIVPNRKRLPYGMMNFAVIRREDYYYVDKTRFIPMIEQADRFFFFIRPRRFGKSLTLNVLQHYYDVRTRDKFNDLFGDLYIGKHPTANRNSYLVLYLNFSGITGELNDYRKGLDAHCSITFMNFCKIYADLLPPETLEELRQVNGAVEQLDYLYQACERAGQKMYLFIDEYDHFTNAILSDAKSLHRYTDETHGEGYLRAFFNKVKAGTYSSIERCFITGVSPVTMDDLTSGFNIGTNYSLTPQFNQMMGFTEEEVREMLTYYSTNSPFRHTVDELIEIMKPWYDNYCFAQDCYGETTMYNSNMVLYFVKNYIIRGKAPQNMIESNIRIDRNILSMSDPDADVTINEYMVGCYGTTEYTEDMSSLTLGVDGQAIPYEYKCREASAPGAGKVWCKLPPIETLVSLTCEGRDKTGYVKEGYAFSPMFTLSYTGKLQQKEVFTTWLNLRKAD